MLSPPPTPSTIAEQASLYRSGLLLGIIPGGTVVSWADGLLEQHGSQEHVLIDISETSAWDISRLRELLLELCSETVTMQTVGLLLGIIRDDAHSGKRSIDDILTILTQMRRMIKIDFEIAETIKQFEILQESGTAGNTAIAEQVLQWLRQW
jgi:hypothetical protein